MTRAARPSEKCVGCVLPRNAARGEGADLVRMTLFVEEAREHSVNHPIRRRLTTLIGVVALALAACGTNPVTGKRELQFVSESQEMQMGSKQYAPARQSEGGDFELLPDLTALCERSRPEACRGIRSQAALRIQGAQQLDAQCLGAAGRQDRRESRPADRTQERGRTGCSAGTRDRARRCAARRTSARAWHAFAGRIGGGADWRGNRRC